MKSKIKYKMNINVNINFGCTSDFKQTIDTLVDGLSLRRAASAFRDILEAAEQVPNTTPEPASVAEEPKERKPRRRKVAEETAASAAKEATTPDVSTEASEPTLVVEEATAPEASAEAPVPVAEEAPVPVVEEAPVPVVEEATAPEASAEATVPAPEETPVPPTMGLKEWKQLLADTRNRLGLEDGQENFAHKREFNSLVRSIAAYYGGDRPAILTPSNLYYCATQVAGIEWDGTQFVAPEPGITPQQVEEYKQAPF